MAEMAGHQAEFLNFTAEIVRRTDKEFEILPRRWVVERTFGWMTRYRRLVRVFMSPKPDRRRNEQFNDQAETIEGVKRTASPLALIRPLTSKARRVKVSKRRASGPPAQ